MKVPTITEFQRQFAIAQDSDKKAYRARHAAGHVLLTLRARIESTGGDWWKWYIAESVRSRDDAIRCMAIAAWEADDPEARAHPDLQAEIISLKRRLGTRHFTPEEHEARLIRKRAQTRERVRRWRERQA